MFRGRRRGFETFLDQLAARLGEAEKRSFLRLNLLALAFTLAAILSLMLALGAVIAAPIALARLCLGELVDALVRIVRWPALLVVVMVALALLYRFGPSRTDARMVWISPGAAGRGCELARRLRPVLLVHREFWVL